MSNEKPIFTATDPDGDAVEYQKRDGVVCVRVSVMRWMVCNPNRTAASMTDSELEAYLNARRS